MSHDLEDLKSHEYGESFLMADGISMKTLAAGMWEMVRSMSGMFHGVRLFKRDLSQRDLGQVT
jgi:hypothetical protein